MVAVVTLYSEGKKTEGKVVYSSAETGDEIKILSTVVSMLDSKGENHNYCIVAWQPHQLMSLSLVRVVQLGKYWRNHPDFKS